MTTISGKPRTPARLRQIALSSSLACDSAAGDLPERSGGLGGHHVLKGLVFHDAEPGFLDRQAGQILSLIESGQDHRLDDAIDVLLCVLRKDGGGSSGLTDERFQV